MSSRERALERSLREHHRWQCESGRIKLEVGDGEWVEIDNAAEYANSGMCERTVEALSHPPDLTYFWIMALLCLIIMGMFAASIAHADTSIATHCRRYWNSSQCTTTFTQLPRVEPTPLSPEDREFIESVARIWGKACKPKRIVGADGLSRWIYGRKDCDIGRVDGERR